MSDRIFLAQVAGQQDEQGRITSHRGMWPVRVDSLNGWWAEVTTHEGIREANERVTSDLGGKPNGLGDTPEVREALGLPPRLVVPRDDGGVGVAGVME